MRSAKASEPTAVTRRAGVPSRARPTETFRGAPPTIGCSAPSRSRRSTSASPRTSAGLEGGMRGAS